MFKQLIELIQQQRNAPPNAKLRKYTLVAALMGLLCVLLFSANVPQGQSFLERVGASFALALGAAILGSLLGFLFGIPRTLQHDATPKPNSVSPDQDSIGYQINTNLEQISDWLTKIIIGIGLVQLGSIGQWLMNYSGTAGSGFGNPQLGQLYVLGILLYFLGAGFLFGYLWTRLSFGLAIKQADQGLVERRIEKVEADIRADMQALSFVTRQLDSANEHTRISEKELNEAVAKSTRPAKVKIFYDAVSARRDGARRDQSILVFQALIESDKNKVFHRNYSEMAYALKDKSNPDWAAAEEALTEAIKIRDRLGESDYGLYEFNRAICRVHLKRPKEEIVSDLQMAAKDEWVRTWKFEGSMLNWLKENDVNSQDIGYV